MQALNPKTLAHHQAALRFLEHSEFPTFGIRDIDRISAQTLALVKDEVSGIYIHPLTGEWKHTRFQVHQSALSDYEKLFFRIRKLAPVLCGLYQVQKTDVPENIWTRQLFPVMGKKIYSASGKALSDLEIEALGLTRLKAPSGKPLAVHLLVAGGRVATAPGPWVVPYLQTREGIKILGTYGQLQELAGQAVNDENIRETLLALAHQKKLWLKLGSDLQIKGAGCHRLTRHSGAPPGLMQKFQNRSVYIPGVQYDQGMGPAGNTNGGIGAVNESIRNVLPMEDFYRERGAVFLADTVATQKLFDPHNLAELQNQAAYREVWYSVRMSYSSLRSSAYARLIQDEGFDIHPHYLLKPILAEIFPDMPLPQAMDLFFKLSAVNLAHSMRAFFHEKVSRTTPSNVPDNYGFFSEVIDTDSDSLKPQTGPLPSRNDHEFLKSWIQYRLDFLAEIWEYHMGERVNNTYFLDYFLPALIKSAELRAALLATVDVENLISLLLFPWDRTLLYLGMELNQETAP